MLSLLMMKEGHAPEDGQEHLSERKQAAEQTTAESLQSPGRDSNIC